MKKKKITSKQLGMICSSIQVIISAFCLIYNLINHENPVVWFTMLCSGIGLLSANFCYKEKEE